MLLALALEKRVEVNVFKSTAITFNRGNTSRKGDENPTVSEAEEHNPPAGDP